MGGEIVAEIPVKLALLKILDSFSHDAVSQELIGVGVHVADVQTFLNNNVRKDDNHLSWLFVDTQICTITHLLVLRWDK